MTTFYQTAIFLLTLALLSTCQKETADTPEPLKVLGIKACDLSFLPEIRAANAVYKNATGQAEDPLVTLKQAGVNTVRLRLWHNPADGHSGFAEVKAFAQELKSKDFKTWLTVHYSDTWADPGKQQKPDAWKLLSYAQLKDSVYAYTKKIVTEINPDYIQIGNEINAGILFPDGAYANFSQLTELVQQGIKAVRDHSSQTKVMLHYAGHDYAYQFFTKLGITDFDLIGLSYYPTWHGKDLTQLGININALANQFKKDIVIAETAYPFTLGYNDYTNNIIGLDNQLLPGYPATPQGQKDFLAANKGILQQNFKGAGLCYWGAEWIAYRGSTATNGSSWENQALWDFNNQALPVMQVFKD